MRCDGVEPALRAVISPFSRRRCFNGHTHDSLIRYFNATARGFIPASRSAKSRVRISMG